MPSITIESPAPNATVSMYMFSAWGYIDPPAGSVYSVRADLTKAGDTTPTFTIESCPTQEENNLITWMAAFFTMTAMPGATLSVALIANSETVAIASRVVNVADIPPSITGTGAGGGPKIGGGPGDSPPPQ